MPCCRWIAYKDDCHYDKPPSLAYVRSLEEEIQELKAQLRQAKTQVWLSRVTHACRGLDQPRDLTQKQAGSHDDKKPPSASPASETAGSQSSSQALAHRNRHIKWE